jgi:hypothetical protein
MPLLRYVCLVGLRLHAGGAGARQIGQATFPEVAEAAAQRFAPSLLSRSVAA